MKKENKPPLSKRKWWFKGLKQVMKIRYKKPSFVYLGDPITTGGIILSNHEGTDAPMSFEIYSNKPVRFWGTYQMNSGLKQMYQYQSQIYYHEKKHWNLFCAKMFCLIASPLTNIFYKGLNLISTYPDNRFFKTIKESNQALDNGENIVIFPEKSTNGYQVTLDGFYGGFVLLAEHRRKQGLDLPIFVSYYNKHNKVYIVDRPINYSTLAHDLKTRENICNYLCNRCNQLGQMSYDRDFLTQHNIKVVVDKP